MSRNKGKPVWGVGVNDSDYPTRIVHEEGGRQVTDWCCPFYMKWRDMLERCYSEKFLKTKPTYKDCTVCDEWLTFSNFKAWMEKQDYKGKHLDKDILVRGNKCYSPKTCVLLTPLVNTFVTERSYDRGDYPIGVHLYRDGRYVAQCNNPFKKGVRGFLGYFDTPEEAHEAWRSAKHKYACQLADSDYVTDPRVADSLRKRYLN